MKIFKLLLPLLFFAISTSCTHNYTRPDDYQNPLVSIDTEFGSMTVEVFEDKVPNAAKHFISLAESGFYQEMAFHTIVKGAFAAGGCPNSKEGAAGKAGTGNAGYTINEEYHEELRHERGTLSLMKGRRPGSTSSQFCLMLEKEPLFDNQFTVIGRIIEGRELLDILDKAGSRKVSEKPKRRIDFNIEVKRKNNISYKFNKN